MAEIQSHPSTPEYRENFDRIYQQPEARKSYPNGCPILEEGMPHDAVYMDELRECEAQR